MTLDELYNLLQKAIHDGYIELSGALRPELDPVLQALDVEPSLRVDAPVLSRSVSAVTLTGAATYRANSCNATLVGVVYGQGCAFTLTLAVKTWDSWTLRSAFDNLPPTYVLQGATLEPADSYLYDTRITQPSFTASSLPPDTDPFSGEDESPPAAGFSGFLDMSGPLSKYADYLGQGPFPLDGAILIKDQNPPRLKLNATIAGKIIEAGTTPVGSLALRLATVEEEDPVEEVIKASTLELVGQVGIGSPHPVTAEISAQLLQGDIRWTLRGEFSDYTELLSGGLEQLAAFLNIPAVDLVAPAAIKALSSFYLKDLTVCLIPPDFSRDWILPQVDFLSGTVMAKDSWNPLVPFITVSDVGVRWLVKMGGSFPNVSACVFGNVIFGKAPYSTSFLVNATLPGFIIRCALNPGEEFDLGQVFGWFYGGSGPHTGLKVTDLNFLADPRNQAFKFQATATTEYALTFGNLTFTLDEIAIWVYSMPNNLSGGITATMLIQGKEPAEDAIEKNEPTGFWLAASYDPDGKWLFEGGLIPGATIELITLAAQFLGIRTIPDGLPVTITIEELVTSFSTGTGAYTLTGAVVGRLKLDDVLGGIDISLRVEADLERRPKDGPEDLALVCDDQEMVLEGSLYGEFMVNHFFVGLGINLKEKESTYIFSIGYDNLELTGVTEWTGKEQQRHQIIHFTLKGVTLGSIIEFFVNLARPGSEYKLDPPWDFLNSIDLYRFTLTVDPTESWVELTYTIDMDLVFIKISKIGLRYIRVNGQDSVRMVLAARFLDQDYDDLSWDVVDDPPPAVPGTGEQLLRVRYLGIGQHIALQNAAGFNSVADVINALRDQMKPIQNTSQNPLDQPSGSLLLFREDSHWLLGLDITVMETLSLAVVFNDPNIYGLLVTMGGPQAGSLAGLSFEILYKRVTDDIGVFKAVFRIPEAFRQFQFGVVSITLGVVAVEIFTNGDFRVDLGFPKGMDFSDSFNLQVYFFIGHGGIYFGKLNGATSSRVPVATNGIFSPVLELGVGLAVGVGREFNKGVLKAGLYVELVGIFEGVLAWFHPNDAAQDKSLYYWVRATAGIIGKLYGCVDFKIIKVAVSIEAYAMVTMLLESCEATTVHLEVGVEVKASVKILFIRINFSFGMTLETSFTIGEKSTPPWITAGGQNNTQPHQMLRGLARSRRRSHQETRLLTGLAGGGKALRSYVLPYGHGLLENGYNLDWNSDPVFPDGNIHDVTLKLIPAFTVSDIGVQWESGAGAPSYKILFLLFADNGTDPGAVELDQLAAVSAANSTTALTTSDLALNVLMEAMFRWSLAAMKIGRQGKVTCGQLEELYTQMNMPETAHTGFNFDNLSNFFDHNIRLVISGVPEGADPSVICGTAFPMIPTLYWTSDELHGVDYSTFRPVGPTYEEGVEKYFKSIIANPPASSPSVATGETAGEALEKTQSMASYIFCDYFLMIARNTVQAAMDLMESYTYKLTSTDSLAGIAACDKFPPVELQYIVREGDTPGSIALSFGLSAAELVYLNPHLAEQLKTKRPGDSLAVIIGVTPQSIALANQEAALTADLELAVGVVSYQLGSGETLQGIATRFGLGRVDELFEPVHPEMTSMAADTRLPLAGAVMAVGAYSYPNSENLSVDLVSALYFTRLHGAEKVTYQPWYAESIFQLNQDGLKNYSGSLPAGLRLNVPAALYDKTATVPYVTLAGDTVDWIGAYFALLQNFNADKDPNGDFGKFNKRVRDLNPSGTGPVVMPDDMTHTLEPMETLDSLWRRLLLTDINDLAARIKGQAGLLSPLDIINVPGVKYKTKADDTLASVSSYLNTGVEELAALPAVYNAAGLFKTGTDRDYTIVITDLPQIQVEEILRFLQDGEAHSRISGMMSRFFLHGLRLPAPEQKKPDEPITATGPMTGLYDLTGQQVDGIVPDESKPPEEVRATANFHDKISKNWVVFYQSVTLGQNETRESLEAKHPDLKSLNPAIHLKERCRPGAIILTSPIDAADEQGLEIKIKEKQLQDGYPAATLQPEVVKPLAAMKLSETTPRTYGFQQHLTWQTPVAVALPGQGGGAPLTGAPSLWVFPGGLTAQAQSEEAAPSAYNLMFSQGPSAAAPVGIQQFAWATLVKVALRKVRQEKGGGFLPDTYEVTGADQVGRYLLYKLLEHLPAQDSETDRIYLLYDSNPAGANPTGFSADQIDQEQTYLIKANLTTETASGLSGVPGAAGDPPPLAGEYYAAIKCHRQFLLLLWECSVVGGGGFHLRYAGPDGKGLPDSVFASDGSGSVWLTFILGSQSGDPSPDRRIYPFNNCAVVGGNIDASSANLYAEAADGSQQVKLPAVQPGNVGFDLTLKNPEYSSSTDQKQLNARNLYSLTGYKIDDSAAGGFTESPEGPAVSPTEAGDPGESPTVRASRRRARRAGNSSEPPLENWLIQQVIPIYKFASAHPLPKCDPLPDPLGDPYAGIREGAKADLSLWFTDIYGNVSAGYPGGADGAGTPDGLISLPVGYMDEVIGVSKWPGVSKSYTVGVSQNDGKATLQILMALQPASFMPTMSQTLEIVREMTDKQLQTYTRIYYQVNQPDLAYSLLTSLQQAPGQEPDLLDLDGAPLRVFAAASCVWLSGMKNMVQAVPDTSVNNTLEKISTYYGASYAELAAYHLNISLEDIFDASVIPTPEFIIFNQGDTAGSICARLAVKGVQITPEELLLEPENLILPLKAGTALNIPLRPVTLPEKPGSLVQIAAANNCTPGRLALQNSGLTGWLAAGVELEYQDLVLTVDLSARDGRSQSFDETARRFIDELQADSRTTGADIAVANQNFEDIFQAGAVLSVADYVAAAGDTLASNGSKASKEDLAALNKETADLFYAGAPLYYGDTGHPAEDKVSDFCATYSITPEQLFYHNRNAALALPGKLMVPGAAVLPGSKASVSIPYSVQPEDSLGAISAMFDCPGQSPEEKMLYLAQSNRSMPFLFAPGKTITVDGFSVQTQAGDSIDSVLDRFKDAGHEITISQLVGAIGTVTGLFNESALLICPPAVLAPGEAPLPPKTVAGRYGVPVLPLAAANCALLGVIEKGIRLSVTVSSAKEGQKIQKTYSVDTLAGDTLNSIVSRFNDQTPTSLEDVILQNQETALIKAGCNLLLPPQTVSVTADIAKEPAKYPGAVFPVTVALEIKRSAALIHPDFDPGSAVQLDRSTIPPYTTRSAAENDPMRFNEFARNFQAVLPSLWLATAKPSTALEGSAAPGQSGSQDIWAVLFAENGISRVNVKKGVNYPRGSANYFPRFFALRPLFNKLASEPQVPISPLNDDGSLGEAVKADLQGIDLEVLARKFLADLDLFLTAAYCSPVWKLNGGRQRAALDTLVKAKKDLALAVSRGLDYVLDTSGPAAGAADDAWESARAQLEQQLRVNLSQAYATDVIMQYDAEVASQGLAKPARLCGKVKALQVREKNGSAAEPAAGFSISSAKTSLDAGGSYVNFLLDVKDEQLQQSITLDLKYGFNELEFNIERPANVEGYEASSWLSFILPIGEEAWPGGFDINLGQPAIPLPLRIYPENPQLVAQLATAFKSLPEDPPSSIAEAELWNYVFTYEHQDAGQDTVQLAVQINKPVNAGGPAAKEDAGPTLVQTLTQYNSVSEKLWNMLRRITSLPADGTDMNLGNAVLTFASLASDIAGSWSRHWDKKDKEAGVEDLPTRIYNYTVKLNPDTSGAYYSSLTLGYDQAGPWPGTAAPSIICILDDGTEIPLTRGEPTSGTCTYTFPDPPAGRVRVYTRLKFRLTFEALNVTTQQNALSMAGVTRNENIFSYTDGGQVHTIPTNNAFVFRTPMVGFAGVTTPLLSWSMQFPFGPSGDLESAIKELMNSILGSSPGDQELSLSVQYGYTLVPAANPIVTLMPVLFKPRFKYGDAVAKELADALNLWMARKNPVKAGGYWNFAVDLFSVISAQSQLPVLSFKQLTTGIRAD